MRSYELELELRKIGEQHPQAEVLILAPTGDNWNYDNQLLKVRGVYYEPAITFYGGNTYFDEDDLYADHPELETDGIDHFSDYILVECME